MSRQDPMSDAAAEAALNFLLENAAEAGKARAQMVYFEDARKALLARLKRQAPKEIKSQEAREDWAREQTEYNDMILAKYAAIERFEELNWKKTHAEATLDAWRTKNANARGAGRI